MKLKYTGKKIAYLRRVNASMKLKPGQTFEVSKREMERFQDRDDFKKVG